MTRYAAMLTLLVAAFTAGRTIDAQITQPLPATICYRTDGRTAHVSWMALGSLETWYETNRAWVSHVPGKTIIHHEVELRQWLRFIPRVEQ